MRSCFEIPADRRFCSRAQTAGEFKTGSEGDVLRYRGTGFIKVGLDERGRNG